MDKTDKRIFFEINSWKKLQEVAVVLKMMKTFDITTDELIEFVERNRTHQMIAREIQNPTPELRTELNKLTKCPDCGKTLSLYDVTEENEQNWRSRWFCDNGKSCKNCEEGEIEGCGYEKLSAKTKEEVIAEYNIKLEELARESLQKRNEENR